MLSTLVFASGCGSGGGGEKRAPEAPSDEASASAEPDSEESSDGEPDRSSGKRRGEKRRAETREPEDEAPSFCDGSCVRCGSGSCLPGFFCDKTAPGGPACSWVPECPDSSCKCLGRALASCECESVEGGSSLECN